MEWVFLLVVIAGAIYVVSTLLEGRVVQQLDPRPAPATTPRNPKDRPMLPRRLWWIGLAFGIALALASVVIVPWDVNYTIADHSRPRTMIAPIWSSSAIGESSGRVYIGARIAVDVWLAWHVALWSAIGVPLILTRHVRHAPPPAAQ